MPRLPVNPDKNSSAAPLTLRVSWAALAVFAGFGLLWFFGISQLQDWLSLDGACAQDTGLGRRARYAELFSCMIGEGPRGWLWLAWCASFPLSVTFVLERALRRSIKVRSRRIVGDAERREK